jgi:hypothetical protein
MQVFLIDSLDVTLKIHMFNISSLLSAPKIEKNWKWSRDLGNAPDDKLIRLRKI